MGDAPDPKTGAPPKAEGEPPKTGADPKAPGLDCAEVAEVGVAGATPNPLLATLPPVEANPNPKRAKKWLEFVLL